jgi:hypothetical protein
METKSGTSLPRILLLDIETAPIEVFAWDLHKQRIQPSNVIKDTFIISWSAKFLFSAEVYSGVVTSSEAKSRDDKRIVSGLWKFLDACDIAVGHNLRGFDIKKINSRFIINGFPPPSQYETIDTLLIARSVFGFTSNSLDYVNKILGLEVKKTTGFDLWKRCILGEQQALDEMQSYNVNDVNILEELYVKLRPWIRLHPNMGLYVDTTEPVCRNCGSTKLTFTGKYEHKGIGKYKSFRCECGAVGRCKENELSSEKKKSLII